VKRAYLELERAGVIVTRQGKGSFVADTLEAPRTLALEEFHAQLAGLLTAARKLGLAPPDVLDHVEKALAESQSADRGEGKTP
jgi:GntR family transcriptional regulator